MPIANHLARVNKPLRHRVRACRLLTLYRQYMREECHRERPSNEFARAVSALKCTNSMRRIQKVYGKHRLIEARAYRGEKTLVIGCGNLYSKWKYCFDSHDPAYIKRHMHGNAYTINVDPSYNPSTVGEFSAATFANLPDAAFDTISLEYCPLTETQKMQNETSRLLRVGGIVVRNGEALLVKRKDDCLHWIKPPTQKYDWRKALFKRERAF